MFEALFSYVFCLVAMGVSELAFPQSVRTYGVGVLPWAEPDKVAAFNASYRWLKLPRSAFSIGLAPLCVGLARLVKTGPIFDALGIAAIASILVWGGFAARDILIARKAAGPPFRAGRRDDRPAE